MLKGFLTVFSRLDCVYGGQSNVFMLRLKKIYIFFTLAPSVPVCRAVERFAIVALCRFAFLLNLYLTFTLCCLN